MQGIEQSAGKCVVSQQGQNMWCERKSRMKDRLEFVPGFHVDVSGHGDLHTRAANRTRGSGVQRTIQPPHMLTPPTCMSAHRNHDLILHPITQGSTKGASTCVGERLQCKTR